MNSKVIGQIAKGGLVAIDCGLGRTRQGRVDRVGKRPHPVFRVRFRANDTLDITAQNSWMVREYRNSQGERRVFAPDVVEPVWEPPTDWGSSLTLAHAPDTIMPRVGEARGTAKGMTSGGVVPRKARLQHTISERVEKISLEERKEDEDNLSVVLMHLTEREGYYLVRSSDLTDDLVPYLVSRPRLRGVFVELNLDSAEETLKRAATLVAPLRESRRILRPVVVGPIPDEKIALSQDAYMLDLSVTRKQFDQYVEWMTLPGVPLR